MRAQQPGCEKWDVGCERSLRLPLHLHLHLYCFRSIASRFALNSVPGFHSGHVFACATR